MVAEQYSSAQDIHDFLMEMCLTAFLFAKATAVFAGNDTEHFCCWEQAAGSKHIFLSSLTECTKSQWKKGSVCELTTQPTDGTIHRESC